MDGLRSVLEIAHRQRWHQGRGLATLPVPAGAGLGQTRQHWLSRLSPEDRAAFTNDLGTLVSTLVARYHDEQAPRGRAHRLVIASYPTRDTPNT